MKGIDSSYNEVELFVVHLKHNRNLSSGHIRTYLAGIASKFKFENRTDPTKGFGIRALIKNYSAANHSKIKRNPIDRFLLDDICTNIIYITESHYDHVLLSVTYQFMFWFALRISEVSDNKHNLKFKNVFWNEKTESMHVTLQSYKFSKGNIANLSVPCKRGSRFYKDYIKYVTLRGNKKGPFFLKNGKAVKGKLISTVLKATLKHLHLDPGQYNTHSLRIGRGTDMFNRNINILKIKKFGRWTSDAYMNYIKPLGVSCS